MKRELQDVRIELREARKAFLNGDNEAKIRMNNLAVEAAEIFNAKAKELAKKHGVSPRLTTPNKIMRQAEFLR